MIRVALHKHNRQLVKVVDVASIGSPEWLLSDLLSHAGVYVFPRTAFHGVLGDEASCWAIEFPPESSNGVWMNGVPPGLSYCIHRWNY
ncbi:hypothetical protein F2Q70_00015366 [Brassica cretica]|uniref:Uncharacterized protein n=1 Tax=Brassica cretica TaxID=69181 RepID=A0A8S9HUR8_BRACR|nr:hypothetical protein F2Q70_00015366 [Brassica cretica]